jgi:hypothetical protein
MNANVRLAGLVAAVALVLAPAPAPGQAVATPPPPPAPAPRPQDVASMDAIIAALYDVISGPAGQKRDWDRFRSLFVAGARLIPTGRRQDGTTVMRVQTPEEYITTSGPFLENNGFFEREIARRTEQYGGIVQLFSTYEARRAQADSQPVLRGINSIQLWNDGRRWWVVTVLWEAERPDNRLPEKYLRSDQR